ncbi:MAG: mycofactocin-associated electron transfer flavoprotein alpha subunit [Ilumatobacteraceae bacterium]
MLAMIPIRDGVVPAGGAETIAECAGRALLAGSSPQADALDGISGDLRLVELGEYAPARWAAALAPLVDDPVVVLPASPDGRDLAPRLARLLGRPLFAGAMLVRPDAVRLVRGGGRGLVDVPVTGAIVATLQPGVRGVDVEPDARRTATVEEAADTTGTVDATVVEVLPPDVATMDLAESARILGGGAGLDAADRFRQLAVVARSLGASMGATRVITDRGWVEHQRQIGTTGVVVDPALYIALGISGAVQHTAGLGTPDHIVSVNTDPHCPMMQMADLAVVADANAVLDELEARVRG